jgi:salicylate hydroxylase
MSFRRWQDGKKIAYTKLVPNFRDNFGAPYYVVHRAHFHDAMHRLALKLGVTVLVNSRVDSYDAGMATVQVTNGKSYTGDLVIAADGEESFWCNYELLTSHRSKIPRSARNTKGV